MQFFPSNPRTWRATTYPRPDVEVFRDALVSERLSLFLHTVYLVNPASPDEILRGRSAAAVAHALAFGALVGAAGVVTHVGSHRGDGFETAFDRTIACLRQAHDLALEALDDAHVGLPPLLLESSAGQANSLGRSTAELAQLIAHLPGPTGICIDTAHLFVAGYPIHTGEGLQVYLDELDGAVGLGRLRLVHLNDARKALGSRHDQHENLGQGTIGAEGLARIVRHPRLRHVPFVLEVPGFEGHGPDEPNLSLAKSWRRPSSDGWPPLTPGPSAGGSSH